MVFVPDIRKYTLLPSFKRDYKKLNEHTKQQVLDVFREIESGNIQSWRRVKRLTGTAGHRWADVWSMRVDPEHYRITFKIRAKVAIFRRVGKHDVYDKFKD